MSPGTHLIPVSTKELPILRLSPLSVVSLVLCLASVYTLLAPQIACGICCLANKVCWACMIDVLKLRNRIEQMERPANKRSVTPSGINFLFTLGINASERDTPACLQASVSDPGEEQEGDQVPESHAGHEPA